MLRVLNLHNGDEVCHSLVLLRGIVTSHDSEGDIFAMVGEVTSSGIVVAGRFKLILELQPGNNNVQLKFQDITLRMHVRLCERAARDVVVPVYIICRDEDGKFQAPAGSDNSMESAVQRISLVTHLLQTVIADKLVESDLPRRTFALKKSCHVFRSKVSVAEVREMSQEQLWEHFARELLQAWNLSQHVKFLAFLACTRYEGSPGDVDLTHAQIIAKTRAHVALGGGGLALFGTGCLHTWPQHVRDVGACLRDVTRVDQALLMDDSCYRLKAQNVTCSRGTYGGCCSTTMGSVLHELCHTFDLGHTLKGVMGRGFDHMDRVFLPDIPSSTQVHYSLELRSSTGAVTSAHAQVRACDDDTFFTKSCAFLLAYHKWMIENVETQLGITFDDTSWTLRGAAGLRVVEVREGERQLVRLSWCFPIARINFVVPRSALISAKPPLLLIAQDSTGCLLRTTVSV